MAKAMATKKVISNSLFPVCLELRPRKAGVFF